MELLFVEGLTLAGARRRIEQDKPESAPVAVEPEIEGFLTDDMKVRLGKVKAGLSGLLAILNGGTTDAESHGVPHLRVAERGAERPKTGDPAVDFSLTEPARAASTSHDAPRRPAPRPTRTASRSAGRRRRA
jgi:hypothetical protein